MTIDRLKADINLNYIWSFSTYRAVNSLVLSFKIIMVRLYREIVAVFCQNHAKHTDTSWVQNVLCLNVKHGGTYNNHWMLKDYGLSMK